MTKITFVGITLIIAFIIAMICIIAYGVKLKQDNKKGTADIKIICK